MDVIDASGGFENMVLLKRDFSLFSRQDEGNKRD